jgi:hypothetical protein
MISKECNFSDFIGAIRGRDFFETILLADREATEAERLALQPSASGHRKKRCSSEYARMIKNLIFFLRYEVKPQGVGTREFETLRSVGHLRQPRRGV